MSDTDVVKARQQAVPKRTREDTAYCNRVWEGWAKSRMQYGVQVQPLMSMDTLTLQYWLTDFILEVRKQNGLEYPPNTLHHLCVALCASCDKMEGQKSTFSKTLLSQTFKHLSMPK